MATTLPEETLARFLSFAHYQAPPRRVMDDDKSHHSTLKAASLVCRAWRFTAQPLLWKHSVIGDEPKPIKRWLQVSRLFPTTTLYLYSPLLYHNDAPLHKPHPLAVPLAKKVFAACNGVSELDLSCFVALPKKIDRKSVV